MEHRHLPVVKLLLDKGADPRAMNMVQEAAAAAAAAAAAVAALLQTNPSTVAAATTSTNAAAPDAITTAISFAYIHTQDQDTGLMMATELRCVARKGRRFGKSEEWIAKATMDAAALTDLLLPYVKVLPSDAQVWALDCDAAPSMCWDDMWYKQECCS